MFEVAIVGSGFAGIGMAIALKRAGIESFVLLERGSDLGGTWRDNDYPGCACDIPSMLYSFSFETNPDWSRVYPPQSEIWSYLHRCAKKYGIEKYIRYKANVTQAQYDERTMSWTVRTQDGAGIEARVLVSAMGGLSNPFTPQLPGIETFRGPAFHSAQWDHAFDVSGKRVAVIGTGASAIQFVPQIAPKAAQLTLFQRTPPWVVPRNDASVTRLQKILRRRLPGYAWLVRKFVYWKLELRAYAFTVDPRLLKLTERFALKHLEAQVPDPALREKLRPNYRMGCKRVLLSDDYYPALMRPNVRVETSPIAEIRESAIVTADGSEHPVDAIVFGTGFRAQDFVSPVKIYGRSGRDLDEAWKDGPRTYLGISVADFPNLYFLVGPNTGLGHNSMILMIEAQIRYVMSALEHMRRRGFQALEVKDDAAEQFDAGIARRTKRSVWSSGCRSWYLDEHGRNTALWPGFTFAYRFLTRRLPLSRYTATASPRSAEKEFA